MTETIRFETFQLASYVLGGSLFTYLTISFVAWFIKKSKPKKYRRVMARAP